MALKAVLNRQTDFTGEFPAVKAKSGLWRFNEADPDENTSLLDSSGCGRNFVIDGWEGTTADLPSGPWGRYFRMNLSNPTTEKTHLRLENDGTIFQSVGERIIVGGWIKPTTYSLGNTYCPIFNTRQGPGAPIFYVSLYNGNPRLMIYNFSGTMLLDRVYTPTFTMSNGGWYFIAAVIEPESKQMWMCLGDKATGELWVSEPSVFTGKLNPSCVADLVIGMHADTYYYAGGLDDWFLDVDSELTIDDLAAYFRGACVANGGDAAGGVDALSSDAGVTLRSQNGVYPEQGVLYTMPVKCSLSGTGKVSVTSEYISGTTAVSQIDTSTSNDLVEWSDWESITADGKLLSPNRAYIRFRVTLTTQDSSKTPVLTDIRLFDIPKAPYERIGYARPVVLDGNGAWEAVLENAYNIIVASEVNGEDTLSFNIPYLDSKRRYLDNEKKIQIVDDIYKIRTVTDVKDTDGSITTQVYAEAEFYDLAFAARKEEKEFDAALPEVPMNYALKDTGWSVGTVTVRTYRTWTNKDTNALAILRNVADLHGGDLVFDCPNRLVHLLTTSGKDSGALFAYKKNMKSIERVVDTRNLITKLYAIGADGMTFADINGGRPYLEDYSYSSDVRVSTLDCSSFTDPAQMMEYTAMRLAQYSKPSASYVLKAMDLSVLTGYEHEAWELGDYVRAEDEELGLSITTRVVRREYNLQEPWNTVLELSTTLKNLGSSASQWDNASDSTRSSNGDIKDMVPFNHLRNSRADDGLAYWTSSGFRAVGGIGVSGTASFRADGVEGRKLSLSQTVYPSSRSHYTISAQVATDNLHKLGGDSQVGIEIEFEYEDGTTETRFIDLR